MDSNLKLYSLGIVVETKPKHTDYILVSPIESLNIQEQGNIKDKSKSFEGNVKEIESSNFKTQLESTNYLRAKWLPFSNSNRITAPDVAASETVILFKFGNVDEYFWTTLFREPELRRLETVLYAYSNIPKGLKPFDKSSSYWLEVSTRDKHVHLHTSNSDGEPYIYDVIVNTKTGYIHLKDNVGNSIELNSHSGSVNLKAVASINLSAPAVNINANTITNNAPTVINKGNVQTSGSSFANPHVRAVQCDCRR